MKQTVDKLKEILRRELDTYSSLYDLAIKKRKLLLEKFSTEFQSIVGKEELLIQVLLDVEPVRRECVAKITGSSDANLDAAVEAVLETDGKSDLWLIGSQLKDKVRAIKDVNEENQKLLEQALELTQYSIKLITRAPGDNTYSATGKKSEGRARPKIFDRKI